VAPVALAGAIMPGFARFIVTCSLHAAEFGVGMTVRVGSMLVLPSSVISGWIVPGGGLVGISGVESGNAAALVAEPVVVEVHALDVVELPSGVMAAIVPVALPVTGVAGVADVPNGNGAVALVLAAGAVMVPSAAVTGGGAEVTVVVCAGNGAQFTLVPAVVGSNASGTGASVVAGAPGSVAAENGLGPVRGDDTIAPGVDGIPMAVVPMVETCATQLLPPSSSAAIAPRKNRIEIGSC
jgi:hypothetical protein